MQRQTAISLTNPNFPNAKVKVDRKFATWSGDVLKFEDAPLDLSWSNQFFQTTHQLCPAAAAALHRVPARCRVFLVSTFSSGISFNTTKLVNQKVFIEWFYFIFFLLRHDLRGTDGEISCSILSVFSLSTYTFICTIKSCVPVLLLLLPGNKCDGSHPSPCSAGMWRKVKR